MSGDQSTDQQAELRCLVGTLPGPAASVEQELVRAELDRTGVVLLPDAGVDSPDALIALADRFGLAALPQREPFAARRELAPGVWSEPEWPSNAPMCAHHELGWQRQPPPYLLLACRQPANEGGRTGVANAGVVFTLLPPELTGRASQAGWTLTRRYGPGLVGSAWPDAFAGMDRTALRRYAEQEEIELHWGDGDRLLTHRTRPAVRPTGPDGRTSWCNLLAFCSEWTMDPAVRTFLLETGGRDALPFETCLGDQTPFTARDTTVANDAYDRATTMVDWRPGSLLILDNLRIAHSTEPFSGPRRMAVLHAADRS